MALTLGISSLVAMSSSLLTSGVGEILSSLFSEKVIDTGISADVAVVLLVISIILSVAGTACAMIPHIPGSVGSLLGTAIVTAVHPTWFTLVMLLLMAMLLVIVQVIDYFMPAIMAKMGGGGKLAVVLATIGLFVAPLIGTVTLPGLGTISGVIIGPFIGALIGAFIDLKGWESWKASLHALKASVFTVLSVFAGKVMKLLLCLIMLAVCIVCCIIYFATK